MQAIRPLSSMAVRNAAILARRYHDPNNSRVITMNDLPVPEGDFFEQHRRKNRTYNTVLATGIVVFGIVVTIAKQSGLIYLNYDPPESFD